MIKYLAPKETAMYEAKCWKCGKVHYINTDNPQTKIFCPECKIKHEAEYNSKLKQYIQLKMEIMWERAIRTIERSKTSVYELREAAEAVLEYSLEHVDCFASQHEMIAAMILIDNAIKVGIQKKIGKHRVDFVIDEFKVILEIDGYMHDYHKVKDCKRDQEIRQELGADWEVIRIPTRYIEENPGQLITAIEELKAYKKKIRKQNEGIIPDWYSDRDKMRMIKALKIRPEEE